MKISNFFWHKTPTGRNIPGVIPALGIASATIYITFMLVSSNAPTPKQEKSTSRIDVADVIGPATSIEAARETALRPQEESVSTRRIGERLSANLGMEESRAEEQIVARNSINTVMQLIMGGTSETDSQRMIDDEPLIPAYVQERELLPTSGTVISQDSEIADIVMVGFSSPKVQDEDPQPVRLSGFETNNFLPRGFRIPIVLLGRFETGGVDTLVEFAVLENVIFQNKLILEKGVRILATGTPGPIRSRVTFNPETILYPDGRELSIAGVVKALDGHSGLTGEYVMPPIGVDLAGYSGPLIDALAVIATETESRTEVISSDGATVTQNRDVAEEFSPRNALIDAGREIAQKRLEERLAEYIERNAPYVKVDPGTRGYIVLSSAVDFETAMIGGAIQDDSTSKAETEQMIREAVNDYYTYGTIGGGFEPESGPIISQPRSTRTTQTKEIQVPGLR